MIASKKTSNPNVDKVIEVKDPLTLSTASIVDIDTPIAKMKEYVGGMDWSGITYYKQVKGEDDTNNPLDTQSNNVAQQYDKIVDYVLKLTSSVTNEGTGEATVLHFRPKVHDVFKAELVNATMGLFTVTEVKNLNYNNQDVYDITFNLIARENIDPNAFTNVDSKVIETLHFEKDSNYINGSPLLLDKEWTYATWLKHKDISLRKFYISKFKDNRSGMLVSNGYISIPLIELFIRMSNPRDKDIIDITLPASRDKGIDPILNAILNRDISLLYVRPDCFNAHPNPIFNTLVYEDLNIKATVLFNDAFKEGSPTEPIEALVFSYIARDSINEIILKRVVNDIHTYSDEIQYMIIPILLLIIKDVMTNNNSSLRRR